MATAESDALILSFDFCEDSDSLSEGQSSDGFTIVTENMDPMNLRDSKGSASAIPKMADAKWDSDREYHESLVSDSASATNHQLNVHQIEIQTAPLFSGEVLACVKRPQSKPSPTEDVLPSYSFFAKLLDTFGEHDREHMDDVQSQDSDQSGVTISPNDHSSATQMSDSRLFVNINAPWSAFICGSQGSGKSHSLSCMLEGALTDSRLGPLQHPLAGMVFYYDKFTGFAPDQRCEAVCLNSIGIPVTVLVSASNFYRMKTIYEGVQNLPRDAPKSVVVAPLLLKEKHLNIERMMKLMAVDEKEGKTSLYMENVCKILRSMAMKDHENKGLDYGVFKELLKLEKFNEAQRAMLNMRLQLLESFMFPRPGIDWSNKDDAKERAKIANENIWDFKSGSLTIVDLSCPFVDESAACAMFNICLAIFLEDRQGVSRIVALDEAHKFMTGTDSSSVFTESLLSVIRQQRHLATRIIIATQEPTISPSLLDLCSMTIVHRFTSPAWLESLKSHLGAMSSKREASKAGVQDMLNRIMDLNTGEAFVFSPSAMLGVDDEDGNESPRMVKMGIRYIKVRVRNRMTADGGRSILATPASGT